MNETNNGKDFPQLVEGPASGSRLGGVPDNLDHGVDCVEVGDSACCPMFDGHRPWNAGRRTTVNDDL